MKEKICIGEKISVFGIFFVIAIPDNDDEFIHVSSFPVSAWSGTFYYNDNTAEEFKYMDFINKYLSPEWAAVYIPGYKPGMKIEIVYAYRGIKGIFDEEKAEKANERLRKKLSSMTRRKYYKSKW